MNPLASYAVPPSGYLDREIREEADPHRLPFQRDRDRIVHTQAFRRLQGKTQVFVAGEGDHYRTRLTHSLEVALVSRDLARTLGLNEDLAECIALAHDLGHPPFGHAGEEALDAWMRTHGLSFEHNEQSLRIITLLEEHIPGQPGLNLQKEIVEGLQKHSLTGKQHTLEAQLVNIADEISYTAHDCEDGLKAELFPFEQIKDIPLIRQAYALTQPRGTSLRGGLIRILHADVLAETRKRLDAHGVRTLADVQSCAEPLVGFSPNVHDLLDEWRTFLWSNFYVHPKVIAPMQEGQQILIALCQHYFANPADKILTLQNRTKSSLPEAVKDYVAGMTDAYAKEMLGKTQNTQT